MTLNRPNRILFHGALTVVLGIAAVNCAEENDDGDGNGGQGNSATGPTGGSGVTGGGGTADGGDETDNTGGSGDSSSTGGRTTGGGGSGTGGSTRPNVAPCEGLPMDTYVNILPTGGTGGDAEGDAGSENEAGNQGDAGSSQGGAGGAEDVEDPTGGSTPVDPDQPNCTGVAFEVEGSPVDMFILMDRTISQSYLVEGTGDSRWEVMTEAVRQFTESPEVLGSGLNAGIVFENAHGTSDPEIECNVADYAIPTVPMGPIAETGPDMVAAMENTAPAGKTPLIPAVEGAMQIAKAWQEDHPERTTVLVLVGDGYPTICDEQDPAALAAIVGEGYQSQPSIRTYAIGVGASSELNLDNYARYGGTSDAVMMEYEDAIDSFAKAMLNITNSFIPCSYAAPAPPPDLDVDFTQVQIVYTPFVGNPEEIPAAGSAANCENGGWYYDNPVTPTTVIMCPCSCANLGAGRIEARFGCAPRPPLD